MLKGQPVINYCPQIFILLDRLYSLVIHGQGNGVWAGLPEINGHFLSFWNIDGEEGRLAPLDEILYYGARHRVIMAEEGHDH